MNTNNQQIEIISEVVEHLETDLGKLKDLDALTPALVDVKLFKNVLFDILPEAEPQYESSRNQLIECILLLRNLFIDCRKLPVKEQKKRIKRASQLLKKKINLDEELSYFMLKLYCLEMSSLERNEIETIVKPPIPPEIKARIRRRRARIITAVIVTLIIISLTFIGQQWFIFIKVKLGDADYQYKLGKIYLNGNWLYKKNETEGINWLTESAKLDNGDAQCLLGEIYLSGKYGVTKNIKQGRVYLLKSLSNKNERAQYLLGEYYLTEENGFLKDVKRGFKALESSANSGYGWAQYKLGDCYEHGIGTSKDLKRANELYKAAYLYAIKNKDQELIQILKEKNI